MLLRRKKDVERLKYAILMKKTVEMNTEKLVLSLSNFTCGRLLLMPRVTPKDIDWSMAMWPARFSTRRCIISACRWRWKKTSPPSGKSSRRRII